MQANTTRRKFFGLMAAGPAVAREASARALSGIGLMGGGFQPRVSLGETVGLTGNPGLNFVSGGAVQDSQFDYKIFQKVRLAALRTALNTPALRGEIESILYEHNKYVGNIEPDIAAIKSYSFMAKVVYQRQRNVARELEQSVLETSPYSRMQEWGARILKSAGIKL